MTLTFHLSNASNGALAHTEDSGEFSRCLAAGANFFRLSVGNFSPMGSLSNRHVTHVIFVRSKIKMLWIYAKRVITFVKDKKTCADASTMNFPRKSMRSSFAPHNNHFAKLVRIVSPLWILMRSNPLPAAIGLPLPLLVKSCLKFFRGIEPLLRLLGRMIANAVRLSEVLVMPTAKAERVMRPRALLQFADGFHPLIIRGGG